MDSCYRLWLSSSDNNNSENEFTKQEKVHQWERFALKNYHEPLLIVTGGGWNA